VFDLKSITSEYLKEQIREEKLFASPINLWVTERTGAGKTSLGNSLLDSKIMKSTGNIYCTDFVGLFKLGDNIRYFDVPSYASESSFITISDINCQNHCL
jgi:predicted GTPase